MSEYRPIEQVNYTIKPPLVGATKMSEAFDIITSHSKDLNENVLHYNDVHYYNTFFYDSSPTSSYGAYGGGDVLSSNFPININGIDYIITKGNNSQNIHIIDLFSLYGSGTYDIEINLSFHTETGPNNNDGSSFSRVYFDTCDNSNKFVSTSINKLNWYSYHYAFNNSIKISNQDIYSKNSYTGGTYFDTQNISKNYNIGSVIIDNTSNTHARFILLNTCDFNICNLVESSISWKIIKRGL